MQIRISKLVEQLLKDHALRIGNSKKPNFVPRQDRWQVDSRLVGEAMQLNRKIRLPGTVKQSPTQIANGIIWWAFQKK